MFAQLLGFVLVFACQMILSESSVIHAENAATATTRTATLPEGYVSFPEDHAAYKIYKELLTWPEARERCISQGARLAITDTRDKIVHINTLKDDSEFDWVHVGIHQSNITNEWVRADNDLPLTSVPWASDNPDDTGECAGISMVEDGLVDYLCYTPREFYVCEILI